MKFGLRENITTQKVTSALKLDIANGLSDRKLKSQGSSPINRKILNPKDVNRTL